MTAFTPDGSSAVEWLFVDRRSGAGDLAGWLGGALPHCAWTSHVVLAGGDEGGCFLDAVTGYLEREPLAMVHLHIVADSSFGATDATDRLMAAAERFQQEAYRERTGSRLLPLPILEVPAGADPRPALQHAGELAARLAKPSLLLRTPPDGHLRETAAALGLRIYLGPASSSVMEILTAAHILNSAMERMEGPRPILAPCRPHEVAVDGRPSGCARQWAGMNADEAPRARTQPSWCPDTGLCPACLGDVVAGMTPSLDANLRRGEGRELSLRTSAALVDAGEAAAAAAAARTAVELSDDNGQRADGRLQQALCLLAADELAEADRALVEAEAAGAASGLVAYHRARVQVAWRDDIDALDRFAEALERGTDAVSTEDLHLEMALSHIRLEEWPDARSHLEAAGGPSAAISFNLGVCDVNDDHADRALGHFDLALELSPPAEDLGRVRFFRGFCLKELGRYDEAVDDLRLAIELEEPELAHHNLLGFCLFKLERHDEAVASFDRAVELDPASAVDWANLGVNHERLGHTDIAGEMYKKAVAMDRSIGFAWDGLKRLEAG